MKVNLATVALCFIIGTSVLFMIPAQPKVTVVLPKEETNGLSFASNFMAYIYLAQADIVKHKKAATNAVERMAWDQIERRINRQDWELVAQMLSRSSFRTNTLLGPSQLTISTNKPSTNSP